MSETTSPTPVSGDAMELVEELRKWVNHNGGHDSSAYIRDIRVGVVLAAINEIERLRAELEKAQATVTGCQWQDISTAPKDGTKLIGLVGGRATTIYAALYDTGYVKLPGGGIRSTGTERRWSEEDRDSLCPCSPTHWMPLPPAPGDLIDGEKT